MSVPHTALGSTAPHAPAPSIGDHLRRWRTQRRMTQLDLAAQANMSTRHLSCVETGRAQPSRELVLRLAQHLDDPIRERNAWLTAAGFAPMFRNRPLAHEDMAPARRAVELLLRAHEPFPALAMDRHWNIIATNRATALVLNGERAPQFLHGANVIRLCHGPQALASRIANLAQLRQHQMQRLQQQIRATADPALRDLLAELQSYPEPEPQPTSAWVNDSTAITAPLQIRTSDGVLTFFTASTVFGSANDITLSEMAMELFLPADEFTATAVPLMVGTG